MNRKQPDTPKAFYNALLCVFFSVLLTFTGCRQATQDPDKRVKYKGPIMQTSNVLTLYSDSAQLKIRLQSPLQQQFENGDGFYPKGLELHFLEAKGEVTTTLKANYGRYKKETDSYLARGNVRVKNVKKNETLNTEELHWDKQKRQIRTDKFVKITTATEILTGHGLTANQDFSQYRILKPSGIFSLKQ